MRASTAISIISYHSYQALLPFNHSYASQLLIYRYSCIYVTINESLLICFVRCISTAYKTCSVHAISALNYSICYKQVRDVFNLFLCFTMILFSLRYSFKSMIFLPRVIHFINTHFTFKRTLHCNIILVFMLTDVT